jgi:hypothetical protein
MPDGSYRQIKPKRGQPQVRAQEQLYGEACELLAAMTNPRAAVFKPHRGKTA